MKHKLKYLLLALAVASTVFAGAGAHLLLRSSATAWTPADITTLAWYDASDTGTITESLGAVSQWDDKSGNLRHVVQAVGASQPAWDEVDTIDFDGANDILANASPFQYANGEIDVYMVGAPTGVGDSFFVSEGDLSSSSTPFYSAMASGFGTKDDNQSIHIRNDAGGTPTSNEVLSPDFAYDGTKKLFMGRDTGAAVTAYVNAVIGNTFAYTRFGTLANLDTFAIGGLKRSSLVVLYDGNINEIVITSNLSTDDRQKMEGYLAWKWGLEGSLPIGHPYKSSAP